MAAQEWDSDDEPLHDANDAMDEEEEEEDEEEDDEGEDEEEEDEEEDEEEEMTPDDMKDLGNQRYKTKDYRGAIEAYSSAIEADPSTPAYYTNRASAYMMVNDFKSAVTDCSKAIELDPTLAKAYVRKAKALLAQGNASEAIAAYTQCLVKDPGNAAVAKEKKETEEAVQRLALARQCLAEEKYTQTWRQIEIVEKSLPGIADIQMIKVESLCGLGRYQEAYSLTTSLMRTNSRLQGLLFWRAKCLYYMNQMPQAIKHLQEAMRNDPDNKTYRTEIKKWRALEAQKEAGNAAFKAGNLQEAITEWTACLEVDPSNRPFNAKLYANRGTAYSKLRRHQEAVDDCTRAIDLDPMYLKAYNRRAESLRCLDGEPNEVKVHLQGALRDYEKAMELDSEENQRDYKTKMRTVQTEIKRVGRKDFYKILGVSKDATDDEIKKAYKKGALRLHPDRMAGKPEAEKEAATAKFKELNEANEVLLDREKRQLYDSGVEPEDLDNPHAGRSHGGGMGGMDHDDLMRMFMHQQAGMGGMGGSPFGRGGGGGGFHFG